MPEAFPTDVRALRAFGLALEERRRRVLFTPPYRDVFEHWGTGLRLGKRREGGLRQHNYRVPTNIMSPV